MMQMIAKAAKKVGKRRGPAPTGKGTQVVVRCRDQLLQAIDDWRADQRPIPTRAEAIRQLTAKSLAALKRGG